MSLSDHSLAHAIPTDMRVQVREWSMVIVGAVLATLLCAGSACMGAMRELGPLAEQGQVRVHQLETHALAGAVTTAHPLAYPWQVASTAFVEEVPARELRAWRTMVVNYGSDGVRDLVLSYRMGAPSESPPSHPPAALAEPSLRERLPLLLAVVCYIAAMILLVPVFGFIREVCAEAEKVVMVKDEPKFAASCVRSS